VWISAERVVGLSPEDGKLIWEYPFPAQMDMNCSQPVVIDDTHVLLSSSSGPGAALLEISGSGAREIWKNNRMKNKFNSSVLHAGYLYGLDETILECMDPKTGEVKWKGGRYGKGQALLLENSGMLLIAAEDGSVALVSADPNEYKEVASFKALEGKTWNHPVLVGNRLYVRNADEAAAYKLPLAEP